jgi:hypothetical protein
MLKNCFFIFILIGIFSCDKYTNTDLRGRWQLRTEKSGISTSRVDTIFYSFDNHVVSVQQKTYLNYKLIFGHVTQNGDSLMLSFPDVDNNYRKSFGIKDSSEHFIINQLDADALILKSINREMIFRKF